MSNILSRTDDRTGSVRKLPPNSREQLLSLRPFATVEEHPVALHGFRKAFSKRWVLEHADDFAPCGLPHRLLARAKAA